MFLHGRLTKGLEEEASSGWGPPTDLFGDGKLGSMRTNSLELLDQYYTVELLEKVAQAYEADLKALHYNNFYHSLRQRLQTLRWASFLGSESSFL